MSKQKKAVAAKNQAAAPPLMILTRDEAIKQNLSHYFTGSVCRNGHLSKRRTHTRHCVACGVEANSRYLTKPNGLEIWKKHRKKYLKKASAKINAYVSESRARKMNATPKWLSEEDRKEIYVLHQTAKQLSKQAGEPYHVDHIVPLKGVDVSGLHVPWNLRVITAHDNHTKRNDLQECIYE